jgi:hypothetical protein
MRLAYGVLVVVTAVLLLFSAGMKFTSAERAVRTFDSLGVPRSWYRYLGTAEAAGALGLVLGLAVPWIGIAAAIGVVLYFVGAVITHLRARDFGGLGSPIFMGLLGGASLALVLIGW